MDKETVDFKELYLREKSARIRAEMSILQRNYTDAQQELSLIIEELKKYDGENNT